MNATFIYLIVVLSAIFCSNLFQSKLNQPLLLRQLYSIDLFDLNHSSQFYEMKVVKSLNNFFKQSQYIYQDLQIPTTVSKKIVFATVFKLKSI